jgi:putative hydrolase of the HAD superfamily
MDSTPEGWAQLRERIRALSAPLEPVVTTTTACIRALPGIRAVLFDLYGTLVISGSGDVGAAAACDSGPAMAEAFRAADVSLSTAGGGEAAELFRARILDAQERRRSQGVAHPEVDIERVWLDFLGALAGEGIIEAPEGLGPGGMPALARRMAVEHECRVNPVWPMPGARDVLAALGARGLCLGIVSNAQFYTPLILEVLLDGGLAELGFDEHCCSFSFQLLEAKPSTRLFAPALAGLAARGITAAQTLFVGNDMLNDVWAASRVGCRTCLFAGDARSLRLREDDARCRALVPDAVLTDLRQLQAAVGGDGPQ